MTIKDKQPMNLTADERRTALEDAYPSWPRLTIATHFKHIAKKYKERPFLHIDDRTSTYEETWTKAKDYAKSFLSLGVKRRDHIAMLMENNHDYPPLMIAASLVGAVFIPINTMLSKEELSYIIRQSDSRYLILQASINGINHGQAVADLLNNREFRDSSQLEHVVCLATDNKQIDSTFKSWETFCSESTTITDEQLESRWNNSNYPDEMATILYTSGSTGKPKGVMLTSDMILRSSYSTCLSRAIENGRRTYAPLPFYHCFAMIEGIFTMSFVGGALISDNRFTPLISLQKMEKYKANDFLCVPSMLIPLLNDSRVNDFDLSHLFAMWCGAAPAPVPVWRKAIDVLGLTEVCTGYGQTEVTSSGVTTEVGDPIELLTVRVGRPKPGGAAGLPEFNGSLVQYKTVDPESGDDLSAGAIGELTVRGNTVTHGYYNKQDETAKTIDKDGWLRTGDVGLIDENNYIEILGRANDLYKVSGELVAPREIENVIAELPGVNEVFVVGVPDKLTTEAGAAFIELKEGASYTRREIIKHCSSRVARFKIPRHVWFINVEEWPTTSTGKVQNHRLRELAKEKLSAKKNK